MSKKKFAPKVWGFEPWFGAKNRRGADSPSLILLMFDHIFKKS